MIEQTITEMDEVKDKTDIGFMESAGIFLNKLSPFSKEIKALIPKINAELTDINTSVQTATDKADEAEQSATDAKNAKDECENMQVQLEANSVHAAAEKTTLANEDEFALLDSTSGFSLKKLTFANLKTILGSFFQPILENGVNIKSINNTSLLGAGNLTITAIPTGAITMWSGSIASIPAGWALCDGANGTPNLRDRFVIGAGSVYAVGVTGGSKDAIAVAHTHTTPAHAHTGSTNTTGAHTHTESISTGLGGGVAYSNGSGGPSNLGTGSSGSHSHTLTIDSGGSGTTGSTGSSGTNANLPPYLALAYIMKL